MVFGSPPGPLIGYLVEERAQPVRDALLFGSPSGLALVTVVAINRSEGIFCPHVSKGGSGGFQSGIAGPGSAGWP